MTSNSQIRRFFSFRNPAPIGRLVFRRSDSRPDSDDPFRDFLSLGARQRGSGEDRRARRGRGSRERPRRGRGHAEGARAGGRGRAPPHGPAGGDDHGRQPRHRRGDRPARLHSLTDQQRIRANLLARPPEPCTSLASQLKRFSRAHPPQGGRSAIDGQAVPRLNGAESRPESPLCT